MKRIAIALVCAVAFATNALEVKLGDLTIDHAWARATVHGQRAGGAFLKFDNRGSAADKLLSVRADVADSVEMHSMTMEGDVMRMRQVPAIEVPGGQAVELKPGGLHLMLMGLRQPLRAGSSFPLTLKFERAGEVKIDVRIESPGPAGHDMKH